MENKTYEGKYRNFMFMAGWRDMLEAFAEEVSMDLAKEALWNLMLVGTFDPEKQEGEQELTTDKKLVVGFVNGCIEPVIKKSTATYNANRENGMKGGRPKADIDIELAFRLHDEEHMTWRDVAKQLGISTDTLRAARREAEKPKNREIETEQEKVEKPKNPEVSSSSNQESGKTEKPKNYEYQGFIF